MLPSVVNDDLSGAGSAAGKRGLEDALFIIGVHRRCGSNFVCDALELHPEFNLPQPITEDYLLEFAHLLRQYVEQTFTSRWRKRFAEAEDFDAAKAEFYRLLGQALADSLLARVGPEQRLVTKTPDSDNLDMFFTLFPGAKLVLLVRDGRDVVESSYRSWPSERYSHWMRMWARGARNILDFVRGPGCQHSDRWKLFHYEDLYASREAFASLLEFAGVAPETYPWDKFDQLPLRGSSLYRGGKAELHWEPVRRPEEFRPTGRWSDWGALRRWQFRRIAGREQVELGYPLFD